MARQAHLAFPRFDLSRPRATIYVNSIWLVPSTWAKRPSERVATHIRLIRHDRLSLIPAASVRSMGRLGHAHDSAFLRRAAPYIYGSKYHDVPLHCPAKIRIRLLRLVSSVVCFFSANKAIGTNPDPGRHALLYLPVSGSVCRYSLTECLTGSPSVGFDKLCASGLYISLR